MRNLCVVLMLLLVGSAIASFKGGCRNRVHYIPHYITHYKKVPQYKTVFKEVVVHTPVPKIVYKTKFLDHFITKTAFKPVYETVFEPQFLSQVIYDTIYKTQFASKFVPQYITQTEYVPQFVTHTADHTQTITVPKPVTVCPKHGGGDGYGGQNQVAQGSGYGSY